MDEQQFKALPAEQRKAHQERLQALGLYTGKIDGSWGAGTRAAFEGEAKRLADEQERERRGKIEERASEAAAKKSEAEAKATEASTAEATRKTKAREQRAEEEGSALGIGTKIAATVAAPAGGAALGYGMGGATNLMLDQAQESRNKVLRGVASDRVSGLTTRDAAQQAAKLSGAVPMGSPTARTAARMAPHIGLGALSIGKGMQTLGQQDPEAPFYADMANRAAGLGYIGAGAGLMKQGLRYGAAPGVAPDAQALAVINSPQLRRGSGSKLVDALTKGEIIDAEVIDDAPKAKALPAPNAPETAPAPKPLNPGTAAYMRQQLKEFGVKGTSSMNKSALATALAEQMAEHGAKRTVGKKLPKVTGKAAIPLAVGSYMAATGDSEAADASTAERAGNAATNFGVGAGAAYGGSKLVDALSKIAPMAMKAGGMGLSMLNPAMMTDMTDGLAEIPPEAIQAHDNAIFNRNARWLPEWMMTQSDMNAKEMAQVPTPSPERRSEGPRVAQPAPEGGFGPRISGRLQRMVNGGADSEAIARFLNEAVR